MKPLPAYQSTLGRAQRVALEALIEKGVSETEVSSAIAQLTDGVPEPITTYKPVEPWRKIDEKAYNEFQRNVLSDLRAAYLEARATEKSLTSIIHNNQSKLAELMSRADDLRRRVLALERQTDADEGSIIFSLDFTSQIEQESDEGRSKSLFESRPRALVTQDEGITLNPAVDHIYTAVPDSSLTARVEVEDQLGSGGKSHATGVDKCLNSNENDFWMEVILADYPILATNLGTQVSWLENTNYVEGAACRLKFTFPSPINVSEIALATVSPFPIDVLQVQYMDTTATPVLKTAVLDIFGTPARTILTVASEDGIPFILSDEIYITINQPSYTVNPYLIDKRIIASEKYHQQLADAEQLVTASYVTQGVTNYWNETTENPYVTDDYMRYVQEWTEWLNDLYEAVPETDNKLMDMAKELGGVLLRAVSNLFQLSQMRTGTEYTQRIKYEYVYGLKEVQFRYREYDIISRYVSRPLAMKTADGNILGEIRRAVVRFDASDTTQATEDLTSVQEATFYLLLGEDPQRAILLPGSGEESLVTLPTHTEPTEVTEVFTSTDASGKVQLRWWPWIDYNSINLLTSDYYPILRYNSNVEEYYSNAATPQLVATIEQPITVTVRTPAGSIIDADTSGEDWLARGTPLLVDKVDNQEDNTILEPIPVAEISDLFSDPSTAAALGDLGYSATQVDLFQDRQFFRSRYQNWVPGTPFRVAIYYSSSDYTSGLTLPVADVLHRDGIVIFRSPVPRFLSLGGTDRDLEGGALKIKVYNFYYIPAETATPGEDQQRPVPFTQNKTDYPLGYRPSVAGRPYNNDYSADEYYPVLAYTQRGNMLQFNRVFTEEEGYKVGVTYKTLMQVPRLLVDLRRVADADAATPLEVIRDIQSTPRIEDVQLTLKAIRS
jgi:hypothetical protein